MNTELTELLKKGYQVEKEFIATLSDEERNAEEPLKIGQPRTALRTMPTGESITPKMYLLCWQEKPQPT